MAEWMHPSPLVLAVAIAIDLVLGDPPNALHPVAWLGWLIRPLSRALPTEGRALPFVSGLFLVVVASALGGPGPSTDRARRRQQL